MKSSLTSGLARVRQRAKEQMLGDKVQKTEELSAELQDIEDAINATRHSFESLAKKFEECMYAPARVADPAKRLQKIPWHRLGTTMRACAEEVGNEHHIGELMLQVATMQESLAALTMRFEEQLDEVVLAPMRGTLRTIQTVVDQRRKLSKARVDLDVSKARADKIAEAEGYSSTPVSIAASGGALNSSSELVSALAHRDDAKHAFDDSQALTESLLRDFEAHETDAGLPFVSLVESQLLFYEDASRLLRPLLEALQEIQARRDAPNVFQRDLHLLCKVEGRDVPLVVESCCEWLQAHGTTTEGLFRVSGNVRNIKRLRAAFDVEHDGSDAAMTRLDACGDPHTIAALLKAYLRDLPDALLCGELYERWILAAKMRVEHDEYLLALHAIVQDLPAPNRATANRLLMLLEDIVSNESLTRMSVNNVGIVFGPTLLRPVNFTSAASALIGSQFEARIVENLVLYRDWLFDGVDHAVETAVVAAGGDATPSGSTHHHHHQTSDEAPPPKPKLNDTILAASGLPSSPASTTGNSAATTPTPIVKPPLPTRTASVKKGLVGTTTTPSGASSSFPKRSQGASPSSSTSSSPTPKAFASSFGATTQSTPSSPIKITTTPTTSSKPLTTSKPPISSTKPQPRPIKKIGAGKPAAVAKPPTTSRPSPSPTTTTPTSSPDGPSTPTKAPKAVAVRVAQWNNVNQ